MNKYPHEVTVTIKARMNDRGEVRVERQFFEVDLANAQPPHAWCKDSDKYMLYTPFHPEPVETTCGVIRNVLNGRADGQ